MVKDALRGYLALASGVTEVTAARARAAARVLVEQGESTAGQISTLAEDLMETSRRNREGLVLIVRHEVEATLRRLGLGAAGDVDALTQRVRRLEQAVRELGRSRDAAGADRSSTSANKSAAKKPATRKSTQKKTTAGATKKAAAKKAAAKTTKSATRKATTKRAAAKRGTRTQRRPR
jgi:polyhydroxyalkanoate synthesis regulator phasin